MDIHVNELVYEEGFENVKLRELSFRDIDQEFIVVHSEESFESLSRNFLYYCFIKPYEGQVFRLIGMSDDNENKIIVDEDNSKEEDLTFQELENEMVSKIIENGDLISNQLLVNIPFDFYASNDDLSDLMETRKLEWLDEYRVLGNPDLIHLKGSDEVLKVVKCHEKGVVVEAGNGGQFLFDTSGMLSR